MTRRFHLRDETGRRGEDAAARYLRSKGYRILERNYRNGRGKAVGEVDIVASDDRGIVFVEVKARIADASVEEVFPEEAITPSKLRKLARVAEEYLRERGKRDVSYRFDAVLIVFRVGEKDPNIRHFEGIFI
ncbi:MAG: YraN family protein [Candidatus Moranbacteria bacterium]|nr:YraN family protein [Candidatus Moranbacteria bacterium]NTW46015.1 YraN family protein [Candidatus Moranbacteria bacterium]